MKRCSKLFDESATDTNAENLGVKSIMLYYKYKIYDNVPPKYYIMLLPYNALWHYP